MAPLADALLSVIPKEWHLPGHLTSYQPGITPLSTVPVVVACLVGYLTTIFSLRELMRGREPMKLTTPFQIHNIYLTAGSGLLLVLMVEEVLPILWKTGLFSAMCADESWTSRLEFYYMINYYIKYVELADTVFLVLKKKPLAFLHVFHHAATALLCFTQLGGHTSVWKKYLTTMQITQFIIDLVAVYFASYSYFSATYWPHLPSFGTCSGTEGAAIFGCVLLTSYLLLFIDFYIRTYKAAPASRGKKPVANGHAKSL
ncbi:hypothetical protein FRC10_003465 [Ceratobasidium sp. 414]|nr:hypothetical protein FRC10_003465 [Ceratobasidium sp. 414]